MEHPRHCPGLPVQPTGRLGPERRQRLDGHPAIEDQIDCEVDDAHSSRAEDALKSELSLDEQRQCGGDGGCPARAIVPLRAPDQRAGWTLHGRLVPPVGPPLVGIVRLTRAVDRSTVVPAILNLRGYPAAGRVRQREVRGCIRQTTAGCADGDDPQ